MLKKWSMATTPSEEGAPRGPGSLGEPGGNEAGKGTPRPPPPLSVACNVRYRKTTKAWGWGRELRLSALPDEEGEVSPG